MAYCTKDRKAKPVAEDVPAWSATADGKHVLAQLSSKEIKYFEVGTASKGQSDDAKTVSLGGLITTRIPGAAGRENSAHVARRCRDYFYGDHTRGSAREKRRGKIATLLDIR